MKKSTKTILAGLAVIPCALAMTACGGGKEQIVDTNGTYNASTASSYEQAEVILGADSEMTTTFDSYRMILDIEMDLTMSAMGQRLTGGLDMYSDSLAKVDGTSLDMETTTKVTMTGYYAQLAQMENQPTQYTLTNYVKNNVMWSDASGSWVSEGLTSVEENQGIEFDSMFSGLTEIEKDGINVWIDNTTEGTTKVKMTMAAGILEAFVNSSSIEGISPSAEITWGDATVYYVFTDGKLEGSKVELTYSMDMSQDGVTGHADYKMTMQIAQVDSVEIDFPADIVAA